MEEDALRDEISELESRIEDLEGELDEAISERFNLEEELDIAENEGREASEELDRISESLDKVADFVKDINFNRGEITSTLSWNLKDLVGEPNLTPEEAYERGFRDALEEVEREVDQW